MLLDRDPSSEPGPWAVAVSSRSPRAGQGTGHPGYSRSSQRSPPCRPTGRFLGWRGQSFPGPGIQAAPHPSQSWVPRGHPYPALTRQVEEPVEDVEPLQAIPLNELAGVEAPDLCPGGGSGLGALNGPSLVAHSSPAIPSHLHPPLLSLFYPAGIVTPLL